LVDANVLLSNPDFLTLSEQDGSTDIIIPYGVIAEIDSKKSFPGQLGFNSRKVTRILEGLRESGHFIDGIPTEFGNRIFVVFGDPELSVDDSLVDIAKTLEEKEIKVVIVSNDVNVRIKAAINGIAAEADQIVSGGGKEYDAIPTYYVSEELLNQFYAKGEVDLQDGWDLPINSYIILKSEIREASGVGFFDGEVLQKVRVESVFGIKPKNVAQTCALHALMQTEAPLVTMQGRAGSGKTLLALAAGLELVLEQKKFDKVVVIRPPIPVGQGIGFLPGTAEEKVLPFFGAVGDSFEVLMSDHSRYNMELLIENGTIEILPTAYMRGRSLRNAFIICDEAQNLTKLEAKTLLSRVSEGTRIVFTGDVDQIDNIKLGMADNGLAAAEDAFKDSEWAICLHLPKTERSSLAAEAAIRM
jgi:PhoH-like ATPase